MNVMRVESIRKWLNRRLSLSQRFMLISLAILLSGMLVIGSWVANRIEHVVIDHGASVTALYMNTFIPPLLQDLSEDETMDAVHQHVLEHLLTKTPLTDQIIALRVWTPEKSILYSRPNTSLTESSSNPRPELEEALKGRVITRLTSKNTNMSYGGAWIETYAPVYDPNTGTVMAVVESFQNAEGLLAQVNEAQWKSWLVVGVATLAMYGLLSSLVSSANRTITQQQDQLQQSVDNLTRLLTENRSLHQRLQWAAARTAEINEQFLHRIGRDLHDGPAQDLALALLRIDDVCPSAANLDTIRHALQSALHEVRALAAGLQLPELESLRVDEVARRAIREFQRKSGVAVEFDIGEDLPTVLLSKKIVIYRAIGEALNNACKHAEAKGLCGQLWATSSTIHLEVCDSGPGFDPSMLNQSNEHLGLVGLQQRVALLGGIVNIQSGEERGTCVCVQLPLEGNRHD